MLGRLYYSFWELFSAPNIFLGKHFLWRAYRKGFPVFHTIAAYSDKNETTYARHLLTSWYQKPSYTTLETDTASIVAIKGLLRETIQNSKLPNGADNTICDAIKNSNKRAWEIIINELSKMTGHFNEVKTLIISMLSNSNRKIRETALLVMEDGKFSKAEKKHYYLAMLADNSKKVKERALDMIVRENRRFRMGLKPELNAMLDTEHDQEIIDGLRYALTKK